MSAEARRRKISLQSAWQRAQVAAGNCASCGQTRERGLAWQCRACLDSYSDRYARRRDEGLCVTCSAPTDGEHVRCDDCRARRAAADRARRHAQGDRRRPRRGRSR